MTLRNCRWALVAIVLTLGQVAVAKITVGPLGIDLSVAQGHRATGTFLVKNVGELAQDVDIELVDFTHTPEGQNQFLAPGTLPRSLAPFVFYTPTAFDLAPGQVQEVKFTIEMPQEAAGPHWTMFMVREHTPSATVQVGVEGQEGGFGFQASVSFGVLLRQIDPNNAVPDGRVRSLVITRGPEGLLHAVVGFENTGTTFLRPSGRVEVRDRTGQTVASSPIDPFRALPGEVRLLDIPISGELARGSYIALAILDFGAEFLIAGQASFEL